MAALRALTGISNGYAVASQDGGHENTDLAAACSHNDSATYGNANEFYLDPLGTHGYAYQSIEVTPLTAKYLINSITALVRTAFLLGRLFDRRPPGHGHVAELPVVLRRHRRG